MPGTRRSEGRLGNAPFSCPSFPRTPRLGWRVISGWNGSSRPSAPMRWAGGLFPGGMEARGPAHPCDGLEGYFRVEWKLAAQRTHAMADAKPFLLPLVIDDTREGTAHTPEEFKSVQWTR